MFLMFLKKIRNIIRRVYFYIFYTKSFPLVYRCSSFAPNSAWNMNLRAELTLDAICSTFPNLNRLIKTYLPEKVAPLYNITSFSNGWIKDGQNILWDFFRDFWSDKSTSHNYHIFYSYILKNPKNIGLILELGIGTNNTDVVSNMGSRWSPWASLRSFRDFCPNAHIYGADIDERILFQEERITTYQVDQTSIDSLEKLSKSLPDNFDLIIDDGLHSPHANINSLNFWLKKLKPEWWLVVEDINKDAVPIWQTVSALLIDQYQPYIIESKHGAFIFAVTKISNPNLISL